MIEQGSQGSAGTEARVAGAVLLSHVRLFRECVAQSLAADPDVGPVAACATPEELFETLATQTPPVVMVDAAFRGGAAVAADLRQRDPVVHIVAVALEENEETILDWAEAGITGYIPSTASTAEIPVLLRQIRRGEQSCSSRIAGSLLRRIGTLGVRSTPAGCDGADLTPRERVILQQIRAGLTNKAIARRLDISLGTTKTHVHNIFSKLNLHSRAQVALRMGHHVTSDRPAEA
jgi:two-component system nitrate/nitrite response regulator NarL